ncbi:hypothetical protein [Allokutzneria sp. NRRL B-24872]|uniref:hypothetical protein n=1 Tax=Allokutzneria sp. NRRL B-24872 TaxID=1137961 RepID=UPI001177EA0B|nr:hypothetical protein [Allokutzneria sp. NRRL B-24872]
MTTLRSTFALAAAGLLLAGCGSSTVEEKPAAPSPTAASEDKSVKVGNLVAECMKKKGFTYVAVTAPQNTEDANNPNGKDPTLVPYDALKTFRQKYGFGVFARDVFPQDPAVNPRTEQQTDPNQAIRDGLDAAQKDAYDIALTSGTRTDSGAKKRMLDGQGCMGEAHKAVYGDREDAADPKREAEYNRARQAFENDPAVVRTSQSYASCLRRLGRNVTSAKPGEIETFVQQSFQARRGEAPIDATAARKGLDDEVKAALEDLECGKDYLAAAKPHTEKLIAAGAG